MENFNRARCLSSNQNLPPISNLLQYPPQQNFTMPYYADQQPLNYDDSQKNTIVQYDNRSTKPAAVAVVRSVIAINKADGMPHLVNQESASLNYNNQSNNGHNEPITHFSEKKIISTAEAAMQPITTMQSTTSINPDDFPGELNFQFFINSNESYKKSFVFSKQLGKVYLSMKKSLPVQFSWQNFPSNLRVRACMIFQDDHSRDKPVQRCFAHKASELPENGCIEPLQLRFIFRTNQWGSIYGEDAKGFLSIVTPAGLPNPGRDYFQVDYQYFCMTSCVTGINRRATLLVFTLENENGFVFGRRSLPVQICSCPKRDMEKEEKLIVNPIGKKKLHKNKKIEKSACYPVPQMQYTSTLPQSMSKLSQSMSSVFNNKEDQVFDLNLKIPGGEEYLAVLNFAFGLILKDAYENNTFDKHREELIEIRQKIEEYNKKASL